MTAIINTDGGEKEPLREKQELSERLGYSKKDFYLSLWNQAEKSTALIFKYLLPCMDFRVIFEELTMYLKHKPVSVVELIRVMIKIESSALEELKQNLTAELIKTFVKANFQRRKLILFMGQPPLYFEEFQQIDDYSIVDIAQLAIDAALNQNMKNSFSVWEGQKKEVPVSLMSLLREFRLAIFEDYTGFLLRLFKKYRRNIAEVLALYPEMLPLSGLMVQI